MLLAKAETSNEISHSLGYMEWRIIFSLFYGCSLSHFAITCCTSLEQLLPSIYTQLTLQVLCLAFVLTSYNLDIIHCARVFEQSF